MTRYPDLVTRVSGLLTRDGDGEDLADAPVPDCPDWTVRQVLAHLVGVTDDVLAGDLAAAGRPAWTAAQVARRGGQSVATLLADWRAAAPRLAPIVATPAGGQLLVDALTHELDLRAALGVGLPAGLDPTPELEWLVTRFEAVLARRDLPGLVIRADSVAGQQEWRLTGAAGAAPRAQLAGAAVDVLRSLTGRRSRGRVLALMSPLPAHPDQDVAEYWPAFRWGPFQPPAD